MKKKISESIQAKTFLSMLALLLACCIIIYAVVMVFLPKNYQTELESQATSDFYRADGDSGTERLEGRLRGDPGIFHEK